MATNPNRALNNGNEPNQYWLLAAPGHRAIGTISYILLLLLLRVHLMQNWHHLAQVNPAPAFSAE